MRSEHTPQQPFSVQHDFGTRLEHWIDSGVWPEGGLLPTREELALIFGRTELDHAHEVLDGLHRRGILAVRPEDGRMVVSVRGNHQDASTLEATDGRPGPDNERWRLVHEARKAILVQGARLAATRASAHSLATLGGMLPADGSDAAPTGTGDAFEREVIVASGNALMLRIYDRLVILEMMTRTRVPEDRTGPDRLAFARRELLTAIAAHQPQAAALLADRIP